MKLKIINKIFIIFENEYKISQNIKHSTKEYWKIKITNILRISLFIQTR